MTFFARLWTGLRYVVGGKTAFELIPTWEQGRAVSSPVNFEANARAYRKSELIFSCVSLKADSAAKPRLLVHQVKDGAEVPDHPLRQVLRRPNPFMTEFDFFSISLTLLDLAGRAYWEKVRSRAGGVVQLWPLRPDWVRPVKRAGEWISGYEYRVPGMPQAVTLRPEDVLDFKLHDPLDLYNGLAPASVAGRVTEVDNSTTDFLKLFFQSGAMPMGLLTTKQKLVDAAAADIRRRWKERYGGFNKWLEPAVLDSDATYQKLGLDFKEMGFEQLDARSEARICMVLRVPPILVGAKVGLDRSTFANFAEARRVFWEDTLLPLYKRIGDECQHDLGGEFGEGVELRWDFSGVSALQEEREGLWRRATAALVAGGLTVNMFLRLIEEPELGPPGDVFLRGLNSVEVPAKQLRAGAAAGAGDREGKARGLPPDDDERRRRERALEKALDGYFDAQLSRIRAAARKDIVGANGRP